MATIALQNGAPSTPPSTDASMKPTESRGVPVPDLPPTSADNDGLSKRPRDARLLHVVLHNLGVQSYQERVPLQLLDFAYRYTSSVLSDALRLSAEGYSGQGNEKRRGGGAATNDDASGITTIALRQAIASRQGHAFESALPKEFMLEQAAEWNRIALPKVERGYGVQLPEEKYCLTGVGWGLKDELDGAEEDETVPTTNGIKGYDSSARDAAMTGLDGTNEDEDDAQDEEGEGRMEDVFGENDVDMTES